MSEVSPAMRAKVVASSIVGNALEWFDFTVFGLFAVVLSQVFFPSQDGSASLIKLFATFGVAFAARPLGGIAFGVYCDRFGRKKAMVVMIWMMALSTGFIGILPGYSSIGLLAPLGILLARCVQGVSAGGEFGSASAMLIEFAPSQRRGLYGSCQTCSQALAFALGASSAYLLQSRLSAEDFVAWGWRIPFLLGVLIGPVGYFIRHRIDESPEFQQLLLTRQSPSIGQGLSDNRGSIALAFCLTAAATAMTYISGIFLPAFAASKLGLAAVDAQLGLILANVASGLLAPISGWLSDLWGRRTLVVPALLSFCALFHWNLYQLVQEPSTAHLWNLQAVGILLGVVAGPLPALMSEIFPVGIRSTATSIAYNFAVMIFGGLAPFINTALIERTGDAMAPVYYLWFTTGLGLIGLTFLGPRPQIQATGERSTD